MPRRARREPYPRRERGMVTTRAGTVPAGETDTTPPGKVRELPVAAGVRRPGSDSAARPRGADRDARPRARSGAWLPARGGARPPDPRLRAAHEQPLPR